MADSVPLSGVWRGAGDFAISIGFPPLRDGSQPEGSSYNPTKNNDMRRVVWSQPEGSSYNSIKNNDMRRVVWWQPEGGAYNSIKNNDMRWFLY